jgi:hypothetical protein
MRDVPELVDGYHRFLANRYPQEKALYCSFADAGTQDETGRADRMMYHRFSRKQ